MANVTLRHYIVAIETKEASSKIVPMSAALVSLSEPFMSVEAQDVLNRNLKKFGSDAEAPRHHRTIHAGRPLLKRANVILAMDRELLERVPWQFRTKAMLFSTFFGGGSSDIDDPYGRGIAAYEDCFRQIAPLIEANLSEALAKLFHNPVVAAGQKPLNRLRIVKPQKAIRSAGYDGKTPCVVSAAGRQCCGSGNPHSRTERRLARPVILLRASGQIPYGGGQDHEQGAGPCFPAALWHTFRRR